jgi:hypothetical protein
MERVTWSMTERLCLGVDFDGRQHRCGKPFTAWSVLRNEFGSRFGVEGNLDVVERASAHSTAGFRNRHNDCQILTADLLFCSEAQFSEDDRLSQGLLRCVVGGRHSLVMHKYNQAVTLVTQTSTGFCGLRLAAKSTVVTPVEDFTSQFAIVMIERSPLNALRLQSIPMVNQFLPGFFQARANFGSNTTAIDNCLKVSQQVSPAELAAVHNKALLPFWRQPVSSIFRAAESRTSATMSLYPA